MQQTHGTQVEGRSGQRQLWLTNNDMELFEWIRALRCLEQAQICQLLDGKPDTVRRRLQRLAEKGFVKRIQYGRLGGLYGVAWTSGRLLKTARGFSPDNWVMLKHQTGLNQIFVELCTAKNVGDYFSWVDGSEVTIHFGEGKIIPDAVIETRKGGVRILIEYDRNQKSLAKLEAQIRRYRDYFMSPFAGKKELLLVSFPERSDYRVAKANEMVRKLFPDSLGFGRVFVGAVSGTVETIAKIVRTSMAGDE